MGLFSGMLCLRDSSFPGLAGCSWPTLTGGLWHFWGLGLLGSFMHRGGIGTASAPEADRPTRFAPSGKLASTPILRYSDIAMSSLYEIRGSCYPPPMARKPPMETAISLRLPDWLVSRIDAWRAAQPDLPSRQQVTRIALERFLEKPPALPPPKRKRV